MFENALNERTILKQTPTGYPQDLGIQEALLVGAKTMANRKPRGRPRKCFEDIVFEAAKSLMLGQSWSAFKRRVSLRNRSEAEQDALASLFLVPNTGLKKRRAKVLPTSVEDMSQNVGKTRSPFSLEDELKHCAELETRVTRLEHEKQFLVKSIENLTCRLEALAVKLSETENAMCEKTQQESSLDQETGSSLHDADHADSTLTSTVDPSPVKVVSTVDPSPVKVVSTVSLQASASMDLIVTEFSFKGDTRLLLENTSPFVLNTSNLVQTVRNREASSLSWADLCIKQYFSQLSQVVHTDAVRLLEGFKTATDIAIHTEPVRRSHTAKKCSPKRIRETIRVLRNKNDLTPEKRGHLLKGSLLIL